jgi:predicted RNA-binding Zn-ribbon protein involved in translation (DUF1610 family)
MITNDPKSERSDQLDDDRLGPLEVAERYRSERDPHAEREIADYVEMEAEEKVKHAERVKVEYVTGDPYEIWNVVTGERRWWVITNPTNLYPQEDFPSFDYALSFHIGVMQRVMSRSHKTDEDAAPHPINELGRRLEQAEYLRDRAIEPEDYQAVGMQLRECLLACSSVMQKHVRLSPDVEKPQAANFIAWSDLLLNELCPGEQNKALRQYVKSHSDKTWQLVNWLTHSKSADKVASGIALDATQSTMAYYVRLAFREPADGYIRKQCPVCGSRDLRAHYSAKGGAYEACGKCGWSSHPNQGRMIWRVVARELRGLVHRVWPSPTGRH